MTSHASGGGGTKAVAAGYASKHYAYKDGDKRHAYNDRKTMTNSIIATVYSGMAYGFGSTVPVTPPMVTIVIGCAVRPSSLEALIGGIATTPVWATTTTESERAGYEIEEAPVLVGGFFR